MAAGCWLRRAACGGARASLCASNVSRQCNAGCLCVLLLAAINCACAAICAAPGAPDRMADATWRCAVLSLVRLQLPHDYSSSRSPVSRSLQIECCQRLPGVSFSARCSLNIYKCSQKLVGTQSQLQSQMRHIQQMSLCCCHILACLVCCLSRV